MQVFFYIVTIVFISATSLHSAKKNYTKLPSRKVLDQIFVENQKLNEAEGSDKINIINFIKRLHKGQRVDRPYAEYERAKYLFFSYLTYEDYRYETFDIKTTILKNLPSDVTAIIYVDSKEKIEPTYSELIGFTAEENLRVIEIKQMGTSRIWARDALPVPVFIKEDQGMKLGLVDAKYYHKFEPDSQISDLFKAPLFKHEYYFEGGNFTSDTKGRCMVIDWSHVGEIPDSVFNFNYGCISVTRFPFVKGVGHIDERIKLLSDEVALTDTDLYVPILQSLGFKVYLLPGIDNNYETYANSLLVNGTLFLPIFDKPSDEDAIVLYESFGFKVVPIKTNRLSKVGMGSIHCITMTYPEADF